MTASLGAGEARLPQIPLFDLVLTSEDLDAVAGALRAGIATLGPRTEAFEKAFAAHLGVRHVVAVSNCTSALHLACLAAGVGPGDEVLVPTYTFVATANAVLYCGARPVFVDSIGRENPSVDPSDVERKISSKTKAVMAVHFGGYPAPVDALRELCDERGVALIEDAAHAPSAELAGRKLGTFGLVATFSFFSNKVLAVGEGGALVTNDDHVAALARKLRLPWAGGFGYVIDEARSALALSRLERLDRDVHARRRVTSLYRQRLGEIEGIVLPFARDEVDQSSCYVMPIMVRDPTRRDPLRRVMKESYGIQTSLLYPPIHLFTAYRKRYPGVSLPRAELASRSEVTIPLFPQITDAQLDRVVAAIAEEFGR